MKAGTLIREGDVVLGSRATVQAGRQITMDGYQTCWVGEHDCGWRESLTAWHNAFWAADHHMRYDCGRREPSSGRAAPMGYEWDSCPLAYEEDVHVGHIHKRFDEEKVWCPGPTATAGAFVEGKRDGDPRMPDGSLDMGALHGLKPGQPFEDEPHEVLDMREFVMTSEEVAEFKRRWEEALNRAPHITVLNEGGMRTTPTPSDNGYPLPPELVEHPTVELGAITTDLGPLPGLKWEGSAEVGGDSDARGGPSGGSTGGRRGWWRGKGHGRKG